MQASCGARPTSRSRSRPRGSSKAAAKKRPSAKPHANSMVAQAKPMTTVAPELSSRSGAASSSNHDVLYDAEYSEDDEEP